MVEELRGKEICLKLDSATRKERSVLAICAQFLEKSKMVLRTLAVHELNKSHTVEVIRDEVAHVLAKYEVDIGQIYVVTTDNGANFFKGL